jgi:hypothetical protein
MTPSARGHGSFMAYRLGKAAASRAPYEIAPDSGVDKASRCRFLRFGIMWVANLCRAGRDVALTTEMAPVLAGTFSDGSVSDFHFITQVITQELARRPKSGGLKFSG